MAMDMQKIVSLCKRRGFIFQSSEIYGGLANAWDYGPYGVELKNNVKNAWWKANVHGRDDVFGMDAAILMHPTVWEASGHVDSFKDFVVECKKCHKRMRPEDIADEKDIKTAQDELKFGIEESDPDKKLLLIYERLFIKSIPKCLYCGGSDFTPTRRFNLMFETYQGAIKDTSTLIFLRPETAQGMFVNFLNIVDSKHLKLPFGLAQIGKAFRNEITPGNFTFRTREFEQMEIEYFVKPKEARAKLEEWIDSRFNWYINLGIKKENLRKRPHSKNELAHYAKACTDIEYNFPFGWSELEGVANRADFDLRQHEKFSGKDFKYTDETTKEKFYPYIIEPSGGIDRSVLAFLVDAYNEEKVKNDTRVLLKLHKFLAPIKAAVLPLLKNRPEVVEIAKRLEADLRKCFYVIYDDTAAIGKLYRRQDEIGTPYCITVDVQSLEDHQVTVRERDSMQQVRIGIEKVLEYLTTNLSL